MENGVCQVLWGKLGSRASGVSAGSEASRASGVLRVLKVTRAPPDLPASQGNKAFRDPPGPSEFRAPLGHLEFQGRTDRWACLGIVENPVCLVTRVNQALWG